MGRHSIGRDTPRQHRNADYLPRDPRRSLPAFPLDRLAVIVALALVGLVVASGQTVEEPPVELVRVDVPACFHAPVEEPVYRGPVRYRPVVHR